MLGVHHGQEMVSVFIESRSDEIDFLKIADAGGDRLLAQLFKVGTNRIVELGMPRRILHVVAQEEVLLRAPAFQQIDLQCVGLRKRYLRPLSELPVVVLRGGADVIDDSEHQDARDSDGADRCNLVSQENPQTNTEHVSPPQSCFQSRAGMRMKYRPCELAPAFNAGVFVPLAESRRKARGHPKLDRLFYCQ